MNINNITTIDWAENLRKFFLTLSAFNAGFKGTEEVSAEKCLEATTATFRRTVIDLENGLANVQLPTHIRDECHGALRQCRTYLQVLEQSMQKSRLDVDECAFAAAAFTAEAAIIRPFLN